MARAQIAYNSFGTPKTIAVHFIFAAFRNYSRRFEDLRDSANLTLISISNMSTIRLPVDEVFIVLAQESREFADTQHDSSSIQRSVKRYKGYVKALRAILHDAILDLPLEASFRSHNVV